LKLILYFADGFAWQYVEERPFMEGSWDRRMPLTTLLGYSSTVMPSILTGRWPRDTGMWTEYYLQQRPRSLLARLLTRPRLRFLLQPADFARLGWFRVARKAHLGMEHRLRIPLELTHLFERHDIHYDRFPPIGLPVTSLADLFAERGLRVDFRYLGDGPDPEAELARLRRTRDDYDVFFYYDPSLDSRGHNVGASAEALAPSLDKISGFLEGALKELGDKDEVEALLFSDHGMTTVRSTFDLFAHLAEFQLGIDYLVFMDSTIARFWFPTPELRDAVVARFDGVPGRLLDDADKRRLGIDFDHDRYGQEVLAADEGIVFHPNYFAGPFIRWARKYPELAMHGYLPEAPSSRGVFLYRGKRWTEPSPDEFSATDIFGVVDAVTCETTPAEAAGEPRS
jgi:Type I phosphodiesterase / nucleotide pyrophosphatase